ncbi:IclR family transcriptional regulator [Pseudodonghicola flavimaris]|uniref:IclR family transcriptional regulator n=1 Tax=Pseudodonghicola flavimaris TaxID=3050036 RepID=A0ABT7F0Z1_9RHOB|nr:IclR family transcriptional regulator [Pseudodonghicola flavimaris]MDK3018259.1 IclR family transcriptional regulator [Pseudodonghicola flavimaris]
MDPTTGTEEEKDRNFVTALARGLDVLRCFRPNEVDLTNTDIAERTGLPKPTVSRLTYTLCALEYLIADPRTGTYRLGAGVLQLGFGVLAGMEIGDRAAETLRQLHNGPNSYVTSALGERFRDEVIYVAVHSSPEDVALTMHVGSRLPLFRSAVGRAILVASPDEDRDRWFEEARQADPAGHAHRVEQFECARDEIERQGYCTGYGDWRPDVNGIAVPVYSLSGARVYGLNVGGPSFAVKKRQLESHYAPRLVEAGRLLSLRA